MRFNTLMMGLTLLASTTFAFADIQSVQQDIAALKNNDAQLLAACHRYFTDGLRRTLNIQYGQWYDHTLVDLKQVLNAVNSQESATQAIMVYNSFIVLHIPRNNNTFVEWPFAGFHRSDVDGQMSVANAVQFSLQELSAQARQIASQYNTEIKPIEKLPGTGVQTINGD